MTRKLAAATVALLAFASPAAAESVHITNVAVPLTASGINIAYQTHSYTNVIAGQLQLTSTYGSNPSGPNFIVNAWCVDLLHDINIGANTYDYILASAVTTDSNGTALSATQNREIMALAAHGNALLAGSSAGSAVMSSAIQLAIWALVYPGLTFTADATTTANVAVLEAYAASHSDPGIALMTTAAAQNLIASGLPPGGSPGVPAVPEPSAMLLLITGLAGLGTIRRRGYQGSRTAAQASVGCAAM